MALALPFSMLFRAALSKITLRYALASLGICTTERALISHQASLTTSFPHKALIPVP